MAKKKKEKKPGFWAKLAEKQITKSQSVQEESELFIMNDQERSELRSIKKRTFIKAGVAGALGVILLYIPYHLDNGFFFPKREFFLPENPFYNEPIAVEVEFMIFSVVLVMIEIWYLTYINIRAVSAIAHVCGHPNPADENYRHNLEALIAVGLERKHKQLEKIGINPYEGLNKVGVIIFQFLLRLKATASNMLFRMIMKRALGRYALRFVLDMMGIPVYAAWNIWGSNRVINEAKIRVMAPPLIKRCAELIYEEQKDNTEFKEKLYDTLQLISESKRSFHYNHFLLSVTLLNKFDVEIREEPVHNPNFLKEIPQLSKLTQSGIQKLFVFGIMIDGRLSLREKKAVEYLIKHNVLPYSLAEIQQWCDDYSEGNGIEEFFSQA